MLFRGLNRTSLLRKKIKEWFTCVNTKTIEKKGDYLKRRVLRARFLVVTVTKVIELPTAQRKKDQPT